MWRPVSRKPRRVAMERRGAQKIKSGGGNLSVILVACSRPFVAFCILDDLGRSLGEKECRSNDNMHPPHPTPAVLSGANQFSPMLGSCPRGPYTRITGAGAKDSQQGGGNINLGCPAEYSCAMLRARWLRQGKTSALEDAGPKRTSLGRSGHGHGRVRVSPPPKCCVIGGLEMVGRQGKSPLERELYLLCVKGVCSRTGDSAQPQPCLSMMVSYLGPGAEGVLIWMTAYRHASQQLMTAHPFIRSQRIVA
ncbi:hypothetical protein IF1G_08038 [Cordyceps javanica]|uniref:Uncharacterized protein n=1 Tax=Cordyceps javanica TaxID=43265 RepID=A0A545UVH2_9HYPO|nr:hypothetical protein IF1G_08038 [Cordyceps javanica]